MSALYNENDEAAVFVLRDAIANNVIAPGLVDHRSIKELTPDDVRRFTQVHLFAGGGFWSVAARLAGWSDRRRWWSASCPCQPYSVAGKGLADDDPRNLWPDVFRLARACRPPVIVGEQVSGSRGYRWFDRVCADLEGEGYACRAIDIPACAVDAPHERNRLYWVALADSESFGCRREFEERGPERRAVDRRVDEGITVALGDGDGEGQLQSLGAERHFGRRLSDADDRRGVDQVDTASDGRREGWPEPIIFGGRNAAPRSDEFGVDQVDADSQRREEQRGAVSVRPEQPGAQRSNGRNGSWWSDAEWIACHDGKARRAKPGLPMLVDGFPGRVDLWSIAGNAIVPVLAAEVLSALDEMMAA